MTKICNGICLFCVLLGVIWAPMLMYSSGNPTNIANPIKDASARVDVKTISGRLTLFETTSCEMISWEKLHVRERLDPHGYLSTYNEKGIQLICCQSDASTLWLVPPVVQARFMNSLRWNMGITFSWQFTRDRPKGKEVVKYELTVQDEDLPKSSEVMEVLNGTSDSFKVFNAYPRYLRVQDLVMFGSLNSWWISLVEILFSIAGIQSSGLFMILMRQMHMDAESLLDQWL